MSINYIMKTLLHAVHLSKDRFETAREARKWLTSNDIKPIKGVDLKHFQFLGLIKHLYICIIYGYIKK
jgi:hypothetical protein